MRQKADELRAEKDIKKAEQHAEQAEQDTAAAIELAIYVLDQAEYAIVDAAIARARRRRSRPERLAGGNCARLRAQPAWAPTAPRRQQQRPAAARRRRSPSCSDVFLRRPDGA
jgi:hypothetical protein